MSPNRYVVPRKNRTTISTDTDTRLAIKAYAKGHGLTVVGAHRLIIREGLRSLLAKENKRFLAKLRLLEQHVLGS